MSITVKELLDKFNVNLDLSENLLSLEFDEDYHTYQYSKVESTGNWIHEFYADNCLISINPKSKDATLDHIFCTPGEIGGVGEVYDWEGGLIEEI